MYDVEEILEISRTRNWEELRILMTSGIFDMSFKILATAIHEAHHSSIEERQQYGLSVWDGHLMNESKSSFYVALTSNVDLLDFHSAFRFAKDELKDVQVANKIKDYVNQNREHLWKMLNDHQMPKELNKMLTDDFSESIDISIEKNSNEESSTEDNSKKQSFFTPFSKSKQNSIQLNLESKNNCVLQ